MSTKGSKEESPKRESNLASAKRKKNDLRYKYLLPHIAELYKQGVGSIGICKALAEKGYINKATGKPFGASLILSYMKRAEEEGVFNE